MLRILVADDHAVVRRHVCEILEAEQGFQVCAEASTGLEAVALTASDHPDIVVLDLSMPQLNGLQAARQIHKRFPEIEMLILTMYDPLELMDEVIESGVRTCILKTDLHHLVAAVHSIWQRRQSNSSSLNHAEKNPLDLNDIATAPTTADSLTEFERLIVQMIAQAKSNKDISEALSLSLKAVEVHRAAIMSKLKISSMFDLVQYAMRKKLVETKSTTRPFVTSMPERLGHPS